MNKNKIIGLLANKGLHETVAFGAWAAIESLLAEAGYSGKQLTSERTRIALSLFLYNKASIEYPA